MMMSEEQRKKLESYYVQQRAVNAVIDSLQQRLELVRFYMGNIQVGLAVLDELQKREQHEEIHLGIGGGVFINARLGDITKVILDIGSGIRIESTIEDAKTHLQNALKSFENQHATLSAQLERSSDEAALLSAELQRLAQEVQKQGG